MVEQGRRCARSQVREEQVESLLIRARREKVEVLLPLLAHVVAQRRRVEGADGGDGAPHRLRGEIQLAGRPDLRRLQLRDRFLGRRVERPEILDVIAEPLRAPWPVAVHTEHVDDAAPDREIARCRHRALTAVAELDEAAHETVAGKPVAAPDLGDARAHDRRRQGRPQEAAERSHHHQGRRSRVQPHQGGEPGSGDLLGRGYAVERRSVAGREDRDPGSAGPDHRVPVDPLGLRRDDEDRAARPLPQPPGDHADGAGGHSRDEAALSGGERSERRQPVEPLTERQGCDGRRAGTAISPSRHGSTRSWPPRPRRA